MSRIGKAPIAIPQGVTLEVKDNVLTVKGPKGTLTQDFDNQVITVKVEDGHIVVERANDLGSTRAKHGLYRALLNNMVIGVTKGYEKGLIVNGVGWKVNMQGEKLVMNVGFSHPVEFVPAEGVKLSAPSPTEITVSGIDKVAVGQVAASIRAIRKPEPYHGYGIRYKDEVIERKVGKTGSK
ncbi:MAG: 50S ribosomal protein L6 [Christensenellaceae bacterium]